MNKKIFWKKNQILKSYFEVPYVKFDFYGLEGGTNLGQIFRSPSKEARPSPNRDKKINLILSDFTTFRNFKINLGKSS